MQVKVEVISNLERRLTITIPAEEIDPKVSKKLNELKPKIKIDGFRPGKVPMAEIERRFGQGTREEVIAELTQSSYFDAIKQENLKPAGWPKIEPKPCLAGQPYEFSATIEIMPEIHLANLQGASITKLAAEVSPSDIDAAIEHTRKQHATWQVVDRPAKAGDRLTIDFEGKVNNETFPGGAAKDYVVELGAGKMLPDFENGLQGSKTSDQLSFKVKFPKDYSDTHLCDKETDFSATVHKVEEAILPEITAEFLKKIEIDGDIEQFRQDVKNRLEKQLQEKLAQQLKAAILDKLIELNPLEIPQSMVKDEISRMQAETKHILSTYTGKPEKDLPDFPVENFKTKAERRVHLGLLINAIIEQEKLQIDQDQVRRKVEELSARYPNAQDVESWYYQDKKRLADIEFFNLEEQAIDKTKQQLSITENKVSFKEAMEYHVEGE